MEKHSKSDFLSDYIRTISETVNYSYDALRTISPILYYQIQDRYYQSSEKELSHSIEKANNKLLTDMLDALKYLRAKGVKPSENNIRNLLAGKLNGIRNIDFWLVLRIAINELDYIID